MTTNEPEEGAAPPAARMVAPSNGSEKAKERGVTRRVLVYVVAAHVAAFYLWLMFSVIGDRG